MRTPDPPQNAAAGLGGTSWQLVRFQGSDDKLLTPDDPAKYTIAFGTDGSVSARIDCNPWARNVEIFGTKPAPVWSTRAHSRDVPARLPP